MKSVLFWIKAIPFLCMPVGVLIPLSIYFDKMGGSNSKLNLYCKSVCDGIDQRMP